MFCDSESPTKFLWDLDIGGKIKENLLVEYGSDAGVGFEGALDDAAITESQRRAKPIFVQCYANCERVRNPAKSTSECGWNHRNRFHSAWTLEPMETLFLS